MNRIGTIAVAFALSAGCQPQTRHGAPEAMPPAAVEPAAATAPQSTHANFRCGDLLVGAAFDNAARNVTLSLDTRRTRLPQVASASGARYADDRGNEFWNKGDEAILTLDGTRHECVVTSETSPWDAARDQGVAFRGIGTEPFWLLEVDGGPATRMRLELDMGQRRLVVPQASGLAQGEGYAGQADDGSAVTLRITRGDCSDGMSDRTYPASVELQVGTEAFKGCGAFLQE